MSRPCQPVRAMSTFQSHVRLSEPCPLFLYVGTWSFTCKRCHPIKVSPPKTNCEPKSHRSPTGAQSRSNSEDWISTINCLTPHGRRVNLNFILSLPKKIYISPKKRKIKNVWKLNFVVPPQWNPFWPERRRLGFNPSHNPPLVVDKEIKFSCFGLILEEASSCISPKFPQKKSQKNM